MKLPTRNSEVFGQPSFQRPNRQVGFLAAEAATHALYAFHYTAPHHGTARQPTLHLAAPKPFPLVLGFAPPRLAAPRRPRRSHGVVAPAQGGQPLQSHRRKHPTSTLPSAPTLLKSRRSVSPRICLLRGLVPLDSVRWRSELLQETAWTLGFCWFGSQQWSSDHARGSEKLP